MNLRAMIRLLSVVFLAAITSITTGCGSGTAPPQKVTGSVLMDGEAIADGYIMFYPTDTGGDATTAHIVAGDYETTMPPGPKKVEITAGREIVPTKIGPMGGPEMEQYIPAKYNTKSELTAEVEVKADNVIDFALTSK